MAYQVEDQESDQKKYHDTAQELITLFPARIEADPGLVLSVSHILCPEMFSDKSINKNPGTDTGAVVNSINP
ncbi:MAG: hypothetical protein JWO03_476 [Bacteroidetes bacterium]|nr:hypothetical protein [Bacteroidota bacterium]